MGIKQNSSYRKNTHSIIEYENYDDVLLVFDYIIRSYVEWRWS